MLFSTVDLSFFGVDAASRWGSVPRYHPSWRTVHTYRRLVTGRLRLILTPGTLLAAIFVQRGTHNYQGGAVSY